MAETGAKTSGMGDFQRRLEEWGRRAEAAALNAADQFGEKVLGDAQQLAPVKTGALKASATAEPAERSGEKITKRIGFTVNYAAAVHENLNAHHDHGQAKFLETAMRRNAQKFTAFVAEAVKREAGERPTQGGNGGSNVV